MPDDLETEYDGPVPDFAKPHQDRPDCHCMGCVRGRMD